MIECTIIFPSHQKIHLTDSAGHGKLWTLWSPRVRTFTRSPITILGDVCHKSSQPSGTGFHSGKCTAFCAAKPTLNTAANIIAQRTLMVISLSKGDHRLAHRPVAIWSHQWLPTL